MPKRRSRYSKGGATDTAKQSSRLQVNQNSTIQKAKKAVANARKKVVSLAVPVEFKPRKHIELADTGWMLPNRSGFPKWVGSHFNLDGKSKTSFMPSQRFVKDFLRPESPYRGLLLYHQVGSGKTCSSIYAAENFMDDMGIVVMLPATVRKNFIKEIKLTCGNDYFTPRKKWQFVSIQEMQNITGTAKEPAQAIKMFADVTKVDAAMIRRNKGVWVPMAPQQEIGGTEYAKLDDVQKEIIGKQLDAIIASRYKFIHYNGGLKRSNVEEMERAPINPFDGKVVVIDEVHNFVSRAIGQGKTGAPLYRLLMQAKNCKLLLLSGTPIVNHPYEAAAIVNLIKGPQTKYVFSFDRSRQFNIPQIKRHLDGNAYVDHYKIDPGGRRASVWLCPEGFKFGNGTGNTSAGLVKRDIDNAKQTSIVSALEKTLGAISVKPIQQYVLPMDKDQFVASFIDNETLQVKRPVSLQRRIMGCISYYQTSGSSEYPEREPDTMVIAPMSDYMFSIYTGVREDEIQDEKRQRQRLDKAGKGGVSILDIPSTYKSHSREVCNFVFPKTIKRVYKKKKETQAQKNNSNNAEFANEATGSTDPTDASRIAALKNEAHASMTMRQLKEYCPKTHAMMQNVRNCKGKCIVYSNFKIAEGLGHIAVALEANGWIELKLRRSATDGEWEIDGPLPNKRPAFFRYEADRNDVPVLMSIFNMGRGGRGTTEDVPSRVLQQLIGRNANASNATNLRGELIKMMMFTKSGAEGLDLKHVRQVHIMEPYWHEVRIQQVIGRAIRLRSHADLPEIERTVKVFRYMTTLTPSQRSESRSIAIFDKGRSADEIVFDVAKRKHRVTLSVLACMKGAAVDCAFHRGHHRGEIPCIEAPQGEHPYEQVFDIDMPHDIASDIATQTARAATAAKYRTITINGTVHVLSTSDMIVYDHAAYKQGKLQRVGHLRTIDATKGAYSFVKNGNVRGGKNVALPQL